MGLKEYFEKRKEKRKEMLRKKLLEKEGMKKEVPKKKVAPKKKMQKCWNCGLEIEHDNGFGFCSDTCNMNYILNKLDNLDIRLKKVVAYLLKEKNKRS